MMAAIPLERLSLSLVGQVPLRAYVPVLSGALYLEHRMSRFPRTLDINRRYQANNSLHFQVICRDPSNLSCKDREDEEKIDM